jgi:hypothetical protein
MNEYNPSVWVMLKFTHQGQTVYKILAGWSGGYLDGDSWQLNSGCVKVEQDGDYYLFHGSSGSVYRCHKNSYRMSGFTSQIYASFQKKLADQADSTMELVPDTTNFMELNYE